MKTLQGTEKHNSKDARNKQTPERPRLSSHKEPPQSKLTPKINCTELQDVKSLQYPRDLFWSPQQSLHPLFTSDQPYLRAHTHLHEWELQMEQLNHAEEGLCISPPASSQTLLPAGLSLAVTCCQLALLLAAKHHRELTPGHWSHFRHSSLLCLRADDRDRNKFRSSPACLGLSASCPQPAPRLLVHHLLPSPAQTASKGERGQSGSVVQDGSHLLTQLTCRFQF